MSELKEMVNHPAHYNHGNKYEPINVIEDWGLNFSAGSAVKYIARAGYKDNPAQEFRKAAWYCNREAERYERERTSAEAKDK